MRTARRLRPLLPGEDGLVCLEIDQATRARNRRVIGRCLGQHQSEKRAQPKRIRGTPRNGTLGVQAFEIADQQQAEVAARRQARSALVRVEPLAQSFNEVVEVVLVENLIQSCVERVGALRGRSCVATHIDACFACRFRLPIAIGDSVVRGIDRVDP